MTLASFVKITESYDVSLVTIGRKILFDSGFLCQDYGSLRSLPMNHTRFADLVASGVVYLPERTETGGPYNCIGPDSAGHT